MLAILRSLAPKRAPRPRHDDRALRQRQARKLREMADLADDITEMNELLDRARALIDGPELDLEYHAAPTVLPARPRWA